MDICYSNTCTEAHTALTPPPHHHQKKITKSLWHETDGSLARGFTLILACLRAKALSTFFQYSSTSLTFSGTSPFSWHLQQTSSKSKSHQTSDILRQQALLLGQWRMLPWGNHRRIAILTGNLKITYTHTQKKKIMLIHIVKKSKDQEKNNIKKNQEKNPYYKEQLIRTNLLANMLV